MGAPVVHFEIITKNAKGVQSFYKDLFGWNVDADNPMQYGMIDTKAGKGINGGIGGPPGETHPRHLTIYIEGGDPPKNPDKGGESRGKKGMPPAGGPGAQETRPTPRVTAPGG